MKVQRGFIQVLLLILAVLIALVFFLTKPWEKLPPAQSGKPPPQKEVFCQPNKAYVDLSACQCPRGTTRTIGSYEEGYEHAVLICKTGKPLEQ